MTLKQLIDRLTALRDEHSAGDESAWLEIDRRYHRIEQVEVVVLEGNAFEPVILISASTGHTPP